MPRPAFKKRKPNSRSPSRSRRAPSNAGFESSSRVKLQQQLADKVIGQRPQDSDDSDRLVTRTRRGQSRQKAEEIFASGGVAKGDKTGVFPTKQQRSQRLRSETNEIIRRSRSKSTEKFIGKSPLSQPTSANDAASPASTAPPPVIPTPQHIQAKPRSTPMEETSILASLKPRRRQASILHAIDIDDSSIINPEDEEQFLPDDESTPINKGPAVANVESVPASIQQTGSASRKRKLGADQPIPMEPTAETPISTKLPTNTPSIARSSATKRQKPTLNDEDVMALPQSSSPEPSPPNPTPNPSKRSKSQTSITIPTTAQLQAHMPNKPRKSTRTRKGPTTPYDPPSSSSDSIISIEESSTFLPRKSRSRGRGQKAPGTPAGKPHKSTSSPPARTPLPLTRNPNQANRIFRTAANSKPAAVAPRAQKSSSGGSRGVATGAEADKENRGARARASRKRILVCEDEGIEPGEEEVVVLSMGDGEEISGGGGAVISTPAKAISADAKAWKSKWADIDDWSLDYEDVIVSTGSSSPLMRASVV